MGGSGTTSDIFMATNAMMFMFCDRRLKENICRVGTHPLGIGLYLFDFRPEYRLRCGSGRQFGVMADEVERVIPEAVLANGDGYKTVDYAMLGIKLSRFEIA